MSEISPISCFHLLKPGSLEEFGKLFDEFSKSAFRIELLPEYDVPEEEDAISSFKNGEERPSDFNSEWISILQSANRRNAKIIRVRLVDIKMPTDYFKFEQAWGYNYSIPEGELIYKISPEKLHSVSRKQNILMLQDFWLFDNKILYFMQYDFYGRFMGVLIANDELLDKYVLFSKSLVDEAEIL